MTIPSLVVLIVAGLLSIAARPAYLDQRWIWAKAVLGMIVGGIALVVVSPGAQLAMVMAIEASANLKFPAALLSFLVTSST